MAIHVTDATHVGIARRHAAILCAAMAFSPTNTERARIVTTEATNNILKHALSGQIVLRTLQSPNAAGLEILALDKAAGMTDLALCMQDGYSTAGSPGTGLGAMQRLSDFFDVFTSSDKGTAVLCQIWQKSADTPASGLVIGCVCVPKSPGDECGDWWAVREFAGRTQIMLVDGLGHGAFAAKAADEAVRIFSESRTAGLEQLMHELHAALRPTRGASLAIAEIDPFADLVRYVGVGNIASAIVNGTATRGMISHNGTLGHEVHKIKALEYPWSPKAALAMHSDGLGSRWDLSAYPGLITRHPSLIAGVLFRDFRRDRDDTTILVAAPAGFGTQVPRC